MSQRIHNLIRPMSHGRYADAGLFLLRFGSGFIMAYLHGWDKLMNFEKYSADFYDLLDLGSSFSLGLVVFAEFICAILIVLGLFTRLATMPLIITMMVVVFDVKMGESINKFETPLLYIMIFVVLMITGAGKYSLDYQFFAKSDTTKAA